MFILIFSFVLSSVLSVPFLPPDTVHIATHQLEVNLIVNENRNYFIMMGTVQDNEDQKVDKLVDYFNSTMRQQPGISLAIVIDCSNFTNNLNENSHMCKNKNALSIFAPSGKIMNVFDHLVLSNHENVPIVGQTSQSTLVRKIRDQIPDLVKQIQDDYDLQQFLDLKGTKVIFFQQNLLKPPFLKKLALVFYRRIDVAVCDNKHLVQKYRSSFGKMITLNYDYNKQDYIKKHYTGDTNFENHPFNDIKKYLDDFAFPTRSRDVLLDFEINQQIPFNITSRFMLNKLMNMDKMLIFQYDPTLECQKLKKTMKDYSYMFTFICYNDSQDKQFQEGKLYFSEIKSAKTHQLIGKIQQSIKFPQLTNLISSQIQMDKCLSNGIMMNKLIVISYLSDPFSNYLIRYVNAHSGFSSIFHFCKIVVPDRFTFKKVEVTKQSVAVLIKQDARHPSGGDSFEKMQHTDITSYYNLKMLLRQVSIKKIIPHIQSLSQNLTQVYTPEQLTEQCFSKSCIIGLIRPKRTRSKAQISLLTTLSHQFKAFNFIWINSECHYQIPKHLKLQSESSHLLYFNQKTNKYQVFNHTYWIKSQVRKWLKQFISSEPKLKRLKLSLTIEPKKCEKNIYLQEL